MSRKEPWEQLSPAAAQLMEDNREAITEEILDSLAREIPAYTRPLEGAFGDAVRTGVGQALAQFVAMVRDPDTSLREEGRRVYVMLGRAEFAAGRSIGALLAAYRMGAQIAWRTLADASLTSDIDQRESNLLAEAIFAYIDELSAESAAAYAEAQAQRAGELDARRGELIDRLTRGRLASDQLATQAAAEAAQWQLPRELAVLIWPIELGRAPIGRLPADSIVRAGEDSFVALVPEPQDPARAAQLATGFAEIRSGLGSPVEPHQTPSSYAHARSMLQLALDSDADALLTAEAHRCELIARSDRLLADQIVKDRLAPLAEETAASRARLEETLLAWLKCNGQISSAAKELHVHEQTLRYRMNRLRDLLGESLDSPNVRYELEFALRAAS